MTLKDYKTQTLKDPRSKKLNFEPDGRSHYVYRITQIIEMKYYYGSQSNDKILGESYLSTSHDKEFIHEQEKFPERFRYKIIKTYDNPGDKMIHEAYLHQKFDVKNHNLFYNRANQTPFGFDTTGSKLSEDHKRKIGKVTSKANKGKVSVIDKNGKKFKVDSSDPRLISGELAGMTKGHFVCVDKNGNKMFTTKEDPRYVSGEIWAESKGRKYSGETNFGQHSKGRKWINNGQTSKMSKAEDLENFLSDGWELGRLI